MSKLCRSVRGGRLGSVGTNCLRLCLLWEAVHPIRRHYTSSDRVQRPRSGAALTAPAREPELRASTAQQGCAGGQQTGEGPKPCGSGPSHCCATGAIIAWVL